MAACRGQTVDDGGSPAPARSVAAVAKASTGDARPVAQQHPAQALELRGSLRSAGALQTFHSSRHTALLGAQPIRRSAPRPIVAPGGIQPGRADGVVDDEVFERPGGPDVVAGEGRVGRRRAVSGAGDPGGVHPGPTSYSRPNRDRELRPLAGLATHGSQPQSTTAWPNPSDAIRTLLTGTPFSLLVSAPSNQKRQGGSGVATPPGTQLPAPPAPAGRP